MTKLLFLFCGILCSFMLSAQTFRPDKNGHVSDPKFIQLAKSRGYTIIGSFDSIPGKKYMAAMVRKNDAWVSVDWNGNEYPVRGKSGIFGMPAPKEMEPFGGSGERNVKNAPATPGKPQVFREESKAGLKLDGKIIIPAIYDNIQVVRLENNIIFLIVGKENLYGLCDFQGKELAPIQYNMLTAIDRGSRDCAFIAYKDKKFGVLSRTGAVTIPLEYDFAQSFMDNNELGSVKVTQGKLSGAYDAAGKLVVPIAYENLFAYPSTTPRLAFNVQQHGKHGILSRTGTVSVPCEYDQLTWQKGWNYISFRKEKHGALDTNGKQIVPPIYFEVTHAKDGNLLWVTTRSRYTNKSGLVDFQGKFILDTVYTSYTILTKNSGATGSVYMLSVEKRDSYNTGLYDTKKRQFILPCEYEIMVNFTKNPFMIKSIGGVRYFGLLSEDGSKVITEAKYTYLLHLGNENMIVLQQNGKYGVTDMAMNVLLPFKYEYLHPVNKNRSFVPSGIFFFTESEKTGVVNLKQQIIIPAKYEYIIPVRSGLICALENQSTVLDFSGKVLLSAPYLLDENELGIFIGRDNSGQLYELDLYGNKKQRIANKVVDETNYNDMFRVPVEARPLPAMEDEIHEDVEVPAEFPGGATALAKYMKDNLKYPPAASESGLKGKCYLRFIVTRNGNINDVRITRGVPDCPECDAEAKRLIKAMPKWIPAKINGKAVSSYFHFPVEFEIP